MKRFLALGGLALALTAVAGLGAMAALFVTRAIPVTASPAPQAAGDDILVAPGLALAEEFHFGLPGGVMPFLGDVLLAGEPIKVEPGILVAGVVEGGPFDTAGIQRGSILLAVGDQELTGAGDGLAALNELSAGSQVAVRFRYGTAERTVSVSVGDKDGRPYLGFLPAAPHAVAHVMGHRMLHHGGIEVIPDGPAAQAGLQDGDRIISVNGTSVGADASLADVVAGLSPGSRADVVVQRGDSEETLSVTLGEHPEIEGRAFLGVRTRAGPAGGMFKMLPGMGFGQVGPGGPGDRLQLFHGFRELAQERGGLVGAAVINVTAGGAAAGAGIEPGVLITAVDGSALDAPDALQTAIATKSPGDTVSLSLLASDGSERTVHVTLGNEDGKARLGLTFGFLQYNVSAEGDEGTGPMRGLRRFRLPLPGGPGEIEVAPAQPVRPGNSA